MVIFGNMLYYTTISHFVITDDTAPNGDGTSVIIINSAFMNNTHTHRHVLSIFASGLSVVLSLLDNWITDGHGRASQQSVSYLTNAL